MVEHEVVVDGDVRFLFDIPLVVSREEWRSVSGMVMRKLRRVESPQARSEGVEPPAEPVAQQGGDGGLWGAKGSRHKGWRTDRSRRPPAPMPREAVPMVLAEFGLAELRRSSAGGRLRFELHRERSRINDVDVLLKECFDRRNTLFERLGLPALHYADVWRWLNEHHPVGCVSCDGLCVGARAVLNDLAVLYGRRKALRKRVASLEAKYALLLKGSPFERTQVGVQDSSGQEE